MQDYDPFLWMPETKDGVLDRIKHYFGHIKLDEMIINDDLSVSYGGPLLISEKHLLKIDHGYVIPIKFKKVGVNFTIRCPWLLSLEGCPGIIGNDFTIESDNLTTLIGGPRYVGNHYHVVAPKLSSIEGICGIGFKIVIISENLFSLKNIHKHLKTCKRSLHLPGSINSNILGLFYVADENPEISSSTHFSKSFNNEMVSALNIITHHARAEHSDILACQEELISVGLKEYARL